MCRAGIQSSRTLATSLKQILGFADDLDIVGRSHDKVFELYINLKPEAEKVGLVTNVSKTKYMKTDNSLVPNQHQNLVNIYGQDFEVAYEFSFNSQE